ncbi:peroxisomal membrane protein PEX13 [Neocloeon triangulifer]|uniref:peroxisomal membrane protein PEX13 n=1 Tax=Neocloeon triangulifer TaxID=2078957 RepID=UPI00286F3010|nr:peroxisomal membrane protein PEX13 [Neocloeon triangulifer]XP_059486011.1 peroxisomal membrane protein PEX13 [Neocloeon triangulifer]XP_059486012.1 peroxisomal membrane protein PEX13 [Neocloeon triangulifer]XP_059486013.1 peroxisomal membrane protein PEX13 [Neocloeon triangulifer]
MSAPLKPWETRNNSLRLQQQQNTTSFASSLPSQSVFPRPGTMYSADNLYGASSSNPQMTGPRAPPRPPGSTVPGGTMSQSYATGSYGSSYSPYGMRPSYGYGGGYGGYSSYGYGTGGYGSYTSPYSSYGMMGGYGRGYGGVGQYGQMPYGHAAAESRFIRMAEENSRPAFESLESMVHAFGSVSMMMESTFYAVHSSFRAVLGVAENFGRMRGMLAQVFSALTIFRAMRWAYHKLLELLGIRKSGNSEKVWADATAESGLASISGAEGQEAQKSSAWPIVMFMSLVMGGPYLIWKLVRSVMKNIPDPESAKSGNSEPWMVGKAPCMIGKATYSYHAGSADELSFNAGDVIAMAPTDKQPYHADGWLIGRKISDVSRGSTSEPSPIGLVPSNHFKTLYSKAKKTTEATSSPSELPVINEDDQLQTTPLTEQSLSEDKNKSAEIKPIEEQLIMPVVSELEGNDSQTTESTT